MKTLILAAAVGMVAFAPSMVPGSTAQTAQAQAKPQIAMANCVKRVGASAKVLRVSPKFLTKQRAEGICRQNRMRPVLSTAVALRQYVAAAKVGQRVATPAIVKVCPAMTRKAVVQSGLNPKAASAENMKRACAGAKGRPIIATAGFLGRVTAGVACADRVTGSLAALRISKKVANAKDIRTSCARAKNRHVFATRNFLTRITKGKK
tara:strand:- start:3367 stop:3987 length:621 start_codon:yes stop_codon:yes gene_type:complete